MRIRSLIASREARNSERGATATEYGLLISFIALAIVLGVTAFGTALDGVFSDFGTWVTTKL